MWLVVVVAYLLFGGLIFTLAERPNEVNSVNAVIAERKDLSRLLEERTAAVMAALMAGNSTMTTTEASVLIKQVINISASLALSSQVLQAETSPLWTYIPSVFFSATIITTIGSLYYYSTYTHTFLSGCCCISTAGYGNRAPVTAAGRTLFIFYALIGIPICLVFLSLVGEVLSKHVDTLTKYISERTRSKLTLNYSIIQAIAITFLVIVGLIIFVIIPSIVMYSVEPWTYGEAVYFCFVTLTTVGFGDFIPADEDDTPLIPLYSLCIAVWLFLGLAWLALLLTQIQNSLKKMGPFIASKVR